MILDSAQCAQFKQDGYLILRQMVSSKSCADMLAQSQAQLQAQLQATPDIGPVEYETDLAYPGAPASFEAAGGHTVRRLRQAYARADCWRDWATDPALASVLQQLLDEPVVLSLAHHNCVMTKHPNYGTATGWHRDIRYWSFARNDLISVWLALGEEHAANGGLRVLPGSQRWDIAPEQLDALDFLRPDVAQNQPLFQQGVALDLAAGDVVLFHSGLFHAAGQNTSTQVKHSLVFAYRGASNPPRAGSKSAMAGEVKLNPKLSS